MSEESSPDVRRLARRAETDPFFLGAALRTYAESEGLDDTGLGRALGCPAELLPRVGLCRRPEPTPPGFRRDVDRIATRFGLDRDALAHIVRRANALDALRRPVSGAEGRSDGGMLRAARDRDPSKKGSENPEDDE